MLFSLSFWLVSPTICCAAFPSILFWHLAILCPGLGGVLTHLFWLHIWQNYTKRVKSPGRFPIWSQNRCLRPPNPTQTSFNILFTQHLANFGLFSPIVCFFAFPSILFYIEIVWRLRSLAPERSSFTPGRLRKKDLKSVFFLYTFEHTQYNRSCNANREMLKFSIYIN